MTREIAEVIERDCEPCGEVACSINGENMRCDMPRGHMGGHSVTLPLHMKYRHVDALELSRVTRAHEECHAKLVEVEKAWLAAETDCIRLEQAIRRALDEMDNEREPFPERHYYGKRKLHKVLADLKVQRCGPR